jgi:hypothetical protein
VDASGTFWETKRDAGLLRIQRAGVIPSDYATLMVEILADNAQAGPARCTPQERALALAQAAEPGSFSSLHDDLVAGSRMEPAALHGFVRQTSPRQPC